VHDVRPQSPSPRRLTNIPITVIALLLTTAWIPKDGPLQRRPLSEIAARIDVSGIVLAATPFIDMRVLISNPRLTRTYLRGALTLLAFYTVLYGLTQWLEAAQGLSPQEAGLVLLPMGIVAAVVSQPISARNLVRGLPVHLAHARRRHRRRHVAVRGHAGHDHGGQPDRSVHSGAC
jgi:predicted MFS family arabinose efflux permease